MDSSCKIFLIGIFVLIIGFVGSMIVSDFLKHQCYREELDDKYIPPKKETHYQVIPDTDISKTHPILSQWMRDGYPRHITSLFDDGILSNPTRISWGKAKDRGDYGDDRPILYELIYNDPHPGSVQITPLAYLDDVEKIDSRRESNNDEKDEIFDREEMREIRNFFNDKKSREENKEEWEGIIIIFLLCFMVCFLFSMIILGIICEGKKKNN